MAEIPEGDFYYRLVVDEQLIEGRLHMRGPLRIGDALPIAEGGGTVTDIVREDDGSYTIHVDPIV